MGGRVITDEPQKQILQLIRDFVNEKSQGERRLSFLRKELEDVRSELQNANSELDAEKLHRELAEQDLKGFQLQLSLNQASIQAQKARISLLQEDVSQIKSDLNSLNDSEQVFRDDFITKMVELNRKIRKFQETFVSNHIHEKHERLFCNEQEPKRKQIPPQMKDSVLEEDLIHKHEKVDWNSKLELHKKVLKETEELNALSRQITVLEGIQSSLCEELQRRNTCLRCGKGNTVDMCDNIKS